MSEEMEREEEKSFSIYHWFKRHESETEFTIFISLIIIIILLIVNITIINNINLWFGTVIFAIPILVLTYIYFEIYQKDYKTKDR